MHIRTLATLKDVWQNRFFVFSCCLNSESHQDFQIFNSVTQLHVMPHAIPTAGSFQECLICKEIRMVFFQALRYSERFWKCFALFISVHTGLVLGSSIWSSWTHARRSGLIGLYIPFNSFCHKWSQWDMVWHDIFVDKKALPSRSFLKWWYRVQEWDEEEKLHFFAFFLQKPSQGDVW